MLYGPALCLSISVRPHHHAVVLLSLTLGAFAFHGPSIRSAGPLIDEQIYEAAITNAVHGDSPYEEGGFFYPPTFARAGVALRAAFGRDGARSLTRAVNVAALGYLLWFTIVLALASGGPPMDDPRDRSSPPSAPGPRAPPTSLLIVLPLALLLLPGVRLGLATGNFSFLVGALAVSAIWVVDRHPVVSGFLLGSTLLIKPLMAGALPLLLLPGPGGSRRPGWRELTRRSPRRLAAAVAVSLASLLLWFDRDELKVMLATELGGVPKGRSLSVYRFVRELGLGEPRAVLFVLVVLVLCAALWSRLDDRRDLLVGTTLAVPLTTLVVWSHTLVMCLPLAALAVRRLHERRRVLGSEELDDDQRTRRRLEALLVVGATTLLAFAHPGGFGDQPGIVQALLLAPFLAAPILLAMYWFRTTPQAT